MPVNVLQDWLVSFTSSTLQTALLILILMLGVLTSFKALYSVALAFFKYFLRPGKNLRKLGNWAVVTGATDGIGKAYCHALAKKGINIVLISRTQSKLEECATEVESKHKVQTKVVPADFSQATAATWKAISSATEGLDIGLLVNSIGLSYDHAEYFDQLDEEFVADLIKVNALGTTKMCQLLLPGMKARRRGAIINVGSAASTVWGAWPLYSVYAATKAYVDMLSRSLNLEYRQFNISVQNQAPLYVATKMSKIRTPRLDAPSPAVWAAAGLRHIGYEATSSPYWVHSLIWGVVSMLPEAFTNQFILNYDLNLRARYYKKKAREAKTQ